MKDIKPRTDSRRQILLLLIVWLIGTVSIKAQDNPYKIDNELYRYFVRINSKIQKPSTLATIDSMYTKAVQKSDSKAQCIAIAMRCKHYALNNRFEKAKQCAIANKNLFFQSKHEQYYFYAIGSLIDRYIILRQYDAAIIDVNHFKEEAFKTKNDYAISSSYRYLGKIYYHNGDYQKAIDNYLISARYMENTGSIKELDQCYMALASIYFALNDADKATFYADKAKKYTQDRNRLIILYINLLHRLIDNNMEPKADTLFNECKNLIGNNIIPYKNIDAYYQVTCNYYRMKKDYMKSLIYADSISDPRVSRNMKSLTYAKMQDYRQAYLFLKENESYIDSVNRKALAEALSKSNTELNEQRLQIENNRLELLNAQMKLKQSEDQKHILTMDRERNILSLNNTQLELNNKNLKIKQSEMEIKQKEQQLKIEKERHEAEQDASLIRTILLYIISFSLYSVHSSPYCSFIEETSISET